MSWLGRAVMLAVGCWYLLVPTVAAVLAIRGHETGGSVRPLAWSLLLRAAFAAMCIAAGVTGDLNFVWIALALLAASFAVPLYEKLSGPSSLE